MPRSCLLDLLQARSGRRGLQTAWVSSCFFLHYQAFIVAHPQQLPTGCSPDSRQIEALTKRAGELPSSAATWVPHWLISCSCHLDLLLACVGWRYLPRRWANCLFLQLPGFHHACFTSSDDLISSCLCQREGFTKGTGKLPSSETALVPSWPGLSSCRMGVLLTHARWRHLPRSLVSFLLQLSGMPLAISRQQPTRSAPGLRQCETFT